MDEAFGVHVDGPVQIVADVPLGPLGLLVEAPEAVPIALVVPGEGGVEVRSYPGYQVLEGLVGDSPNLPSPSGLRSNPPDVLSGAGGQVLRQSGPLPFAKSHWVVQGQ